MKITITISSLVILATPSFAQTVSVKPDASFDHGSSASVTELACNNTDYASLGLSTISDIYTYLQRNSPSGKLSIGSIAALSTGLFDDGDRCGTCWRLSNDQGSDTVLALHRADTSFVVSKDSFDNFLGDASLAVTNATLTPLVLSDCFNGSDFIPFQPASTTGTDNSTTASSTTAVATSTASTISTDTVWTPANSSTAYVTTVWSTSNAAVATSIAVTTATDTATTTANSSAADDTTDWSTASTSAVVAASVTATAASDTWSTIAHSSVVDDTTVWSLAAATTLTVVATASTW